MVIMVISKVLLPWSTRLVECILEDLHFPHPRPNQQQSFISTQYPVLLSMEII